MIKRYLFLFLISAIFLVAPYAVHSSAASDIPSLTKEELKAMLDNPDLVIIDVRMEKEWKKSALKIKGAIWEDSEEFEKWAGKYPKDKTIVFY